MDMGKVHPRRQTLGFKHQGECPVLGHDRSRTRDRCAPHRVDLLQVARDIGIGGTCLIGLGEDGSGRKGKRGEGKRGAGAGHRHSFSIWRRIFRLAAKPKAAVDVPAVPHSRGPRSAVAYGGRKDGIARLRPGGCRRGRGFANTKTRRSAGCGRPSQDARILVAVRNANWRSARKPSGAPRRRIPPAPGRQGQGHRRAASRG